MGNWFSLSLPSMAILLLFCYILTHVSSMTIVDFLVNQLNQSVDPCQDFFSFACTAKENKMAKLQRIVDNRLIMSLYQNVSEVPPSPINKARILFQSCSNRKELSQNGPMNLLHKLERISQVNIYTPDDQLDLTNLTIEAWRLMGLRPWFSFDVGTTNSTKPVIKVAYPEPFLRRTDGLDVYGDRLLKDNYISFLTTLFMFYVEDLKLPTNEEEVRAQIIEAVDFEEKLFQISLRKEQIEDYVEPKTLKDFEQRFTVMDVRKFFKAFASLKAKEIFDQNPLVQLHVSENYFFRLSKFLEETSEFTIKAYLTMMIARDQTYELTGKYWEIKNYFLQNFLNQTGVWPHRTREDACLNITQSLLPELVARLYVDNFFNQETRKSAAGIIQNLVASFHNILQESVWMDSKTKSYALKKLETMGQQVGYMDSVMSDLNLEESYARINISERDSFSQMIEKVLSYTLLAEFDVLVNTKRKMGPVATSVDAFNFKESNFIAVPAVLLQPPFYQSLWPMLINYAGLGYTVGHEIAHSFDTEGKQYGINGTRVDWWKDESLNEYDSRTRCFVEQYSQFLIPEVNRTVDGLRTLNENLADNIGIRMAYQAYKLNLEEPRLSHLVTNDQLFFIMAIQMDCIPFQPHELDLFMDIDDHAVPRARINVPLANFPEFSKAFNCPAGSPMNPEKRCRLF